MAHYTFHSTQAEVDLPSYVVVATHNEASAKKAANHMESLNLNERNIGGRAVFGQIYGMAEQISVPLGEVYKYVYT